MTLDPLRLAQLESDLRLTAEQRIRAAGASEPEGAPGRTGCCPSTGTRTTSIRNGQQKRRREALPQAPAASTASHRLALPSVHVLVFDATQFSSMRHDTM
jgi:hypothetical protein